MSTSLVFNPSNQGSVPEVSPQEVFQEVIQNKKKCRLIDVRRADEFNGEYGHIEGAERIEMGPAFFAFLTDADKNQEIVLICRSGGRSGGCTQQALQMGFRHVINMTGGMIAWNTLNLPVVKK